MELILGNEESHSMGTLNEFRHVILGQNFRERKLKNLFYKKK